MYVLRELNIGKNNVDIFFFNSFSLIISLQVNLTENLLLYKIKITLLQSFLISKAIF